jgi:hypothetical protein
MLSLHGMSGNFQAKNTRTGIEEVIHGRKLQNLWGVMFIVQRRKRIL